MITERTKSILLLTSYFSNDSDRLNKPLSIGEWNKLVRWLQPNNISPEDFLTGNAEHILRGFEDKSITLDRVTALLDRKSALAIALDKWINAGIWIISRGDQNYPKSIKRLLKEKAPPILFGIGNKNLLEGEYVGMVGARNTSYDELEVAEEITDNLVKNNIGIVSGGARGVDETAMLRALEKNGKCIGILADSLIKKSTTSVYRKYLLNKQLVLISPYNPEAGFNVGNAMGRNKLIYTASIATIIIKSDLKGGTWEGAKENIKQRWVPLWVLKTGESNKKNGNSEIVKLGGHWIQDYKNINFKTISSKRHLKNQEPKNLFSETNIINENITINSEKKEQTDNERVVTCDEKPTMFNYFLISLAYNFKNLEFSKMDITDILELTPKQLEIWLSKGIDEHFIVKKSKPVRYLLNPDKEIQFK